MLSMTADMNYDDPTLKEVQVTIGKIKYVLREASGETAIRWENAKLKFHLTGDGVKGTLEGMANTKTLLVAGCLFTKADNTPVPESVILSWPNHIQQDLFDRAKLISGLSERVTKTDLKKQIDEATLQLRQLEAEEKLTEDQRKNEQSAGTVGSA